MVPSAGAMISFCIFIASRIINTSPALTASPALTLTSRTLPGIGALIVAAPAATGFAAGAGAAAGAAFGAAAGAAAGAALGAAALGAATPPISSTSTSYAVPLTVMVYFFTGNTLLQNCLKYIKLKCC